METAVLTSDDHRLVRQEKLERIKPLLRLSMPHVWRNGRIDFLTEELRNETKISATHRISALGYDDRMRELIEMHRGGLILDCGAGSKSEYLPNVVNFEIVEYPSTDVLGVGEHLPFIENSFDAVMSVAALEHVRDPWRCAAELVRVLKPGGDLLCAVPFLQPLHGYPHHYFNATHQGLQRLFEDSMESLISWVPDAGHPIHAVHWILASWADGLAPDLRQRFLAMRVEDFLDSPWDLAKQPFARELPPHKQFELACGTLLTAKKTVPPPRKSEAFLATAGQIVESVLGQTMRLQLGASGRFVAKMVKRGN